MTGYSHCLLADTSAVHRPDHGKQAAVDRRAEATGQLRAAA
jgi:hypothetical protein